MEAPVAQNWILALQTVLFVAQTGLLTWYASETKEIRLQANEENKNLLGQLAAMQEQTRLNAQLLEQQIKSENKAARPFIVWKKVLAINRLGQTSLLFENQGAIIRLVEWRCTTAPITVPDTAFLPEKEAFMIDVANQNQTAFFGFRYENKLGQIEKMMWELPMKKLVPQPYFGDDFDMWPVTLPPS